MTRPHYSTTHARLHELADRFTWESTNTWMEHQPDWLRQVKALRHPTDNGVNLLLMVDGLRRSIESQDLPGEIMAVLTLLRSIEVPAQSVVFEELRIGADKLGDPYVTGMLHAAEARALICDSESSPAVILEALERAVNAASVARDLSLDEAVCGAFGSYAKIVGVYGPARSAAAFCFDETDVGSHAWVLGRLNLATADVATGNLDAARDHYEQVHPFLSARSLPLQNVAEWVRILSTDPLPMFTQAPLSELEALVIRGRAIRRLVLLDLTGIVSFEDGLREILTDRPIDSQTGLVPVGTLRELLNESVAIGHQSQLAAVRLPGLLAATGRMESDSASALIGAVAGRFARALDDGLMIARLDVDCFAVFGDLDPAAFQAALENIAEELQQPFNLPSGASELRLHSNVTVTQGEPGDTGYSVWERAFATDHPEIPGTVRLTIADSEQSERRFLLAQELLSDGLETHVKIEFQPIVDTDRQRVTGFESLLRWESTALGRVNPEFVIDIAERCGAIGRLEYCIVSRSIEGAAVLQATDSSCRVNVNLTGVQLIGSSMVEHLVGECLRLGVLTSTIGIELTESTLLNFAAAAPTLDLLAAHGFTIALDDFGTGYSNLSYLVQMSNVGLKIDGSFVRDIVDNERAHAVCRMLIVAALSLRVPIVAEQVETDAHAARLHDLGCSLHQGYRYARSLPLEQASAVLKDPSTAWDWPEFHGPTETGRA